MKSECLLERIARYLPSFTIAKDGLKYLTRYYVFLKDRVLANIFIHFFHRSDMDMGTCGLGLLHNHPFSGVSIIWTTGYREERLEKDGSISVRIYKRFSINFISKKTFHRVDLLDETKGCWTIFVVGPRSKKGWGFYDRITRQYIPFQSVEGAIE